MVRGLTKSEIVAAGLATLDDLGLEGLTVRALASRLGVKAPALYWHLRDKQALLDEMATELWRHIIGEWQPRSRAPSWRESMTTFAQVTRKTLLAHRDGAKVFSGTYLTDATLLGEQEALLEAMLKSGFSLADAVRGWTLLYSFTIGYCIEEQAVAQTTAAGDDRYLPEQRAKRLDRTQTPLAHDAGAHLFEEPGRRFVELVAIIVDSLDRLRRTPRPRSRRKP